MKERPIIFNGEMVRAILDGRKTQTRRVVKLNDDWVVGPNYEGEHWPIRLVKSGLKRMKCPYGEIGDRLWVRENFFCITGEPGPVVCNYQADYANGEFKGMWKPSIHMPRWASRITLEITGVSVERLQDIQTNDAICEGVKCPPPYLGVGYDNMPIENDEYQDWHPYDAFADLWESIHGPDSWSANPWVWVIEFEREN